MYVNYSSIFFNVQLWVKKNKKEQRSRSVAWQRCHQLVRREP